LRNISAPELQRALAPLQVEAQQLLESDRVAAADRAIETLVDMRYIGQSYELSQAVTDNLDLDDLANDFHDAHERKFGHADRQAAVEIVNLRVLAVGKRPPFALPELAAGSIEPPTDARIGERQLYSAVSGDWHKAPIYDREALRAGNQIQGPAVIEEVSSTTVVRAGDSARVDDIGNLIITIGMREI